MEPAAEGLYSEMDNPQIIDQLERGPEEPQTIPVDVTRAEMPEEGKPKSYLRGRAKILMGLSPDRGRAAVSEGRPQRNADGRLARDFWRALLLRAERRICLFERHACFGRECLAMDKTLGFGHAAAEAVWTHGDSGWVEDHRLWGQG